MAKPFSVYLDRPKQKRHITFVQVRVPTELVEKTKQIVATLDKTLSDVVRASLQKFVDDRAPKPKPRQMDFEEVQALRTGWN